MEIVKLKADEIDVHKVRGKGNVRVMTIMTIELKFRENTKAFRQSLNKNNLTTFITYTAHCQHLLF